MKHLSYVATVLFGFAIVALAACSNGGSTPSYPVPTATPAPVTTAVAIPATATSIPIPSVNGVTGTANVPPPSGPVTITSSVSVGPPTGIPALTSTGSGIFNVIQTQNYDAFTPSTPTTWGPGATLSYTLPTGVSTAGVWYIATYDTGTPQNGYYYGTLGPGVASGQTLTFTSSRGYSFAARQYVFVVYQSQ